MQRIHDLPQHERPREKLWLQGSAFLSDSELLAILLRSGIRGKSALDLARELLNHFGSLQQLFNASAEAICHFQGITKIHYAQLQAAKELFHRCLKEELAKPLEIRDANALHHFLISKLANQGREVFAVLFFTTQLQLIAYEELFFGSLNKATIHPREVVKRTLYHNAAAIVLAHNHPSGDPTPSPEDFNITRIIKDSVQWLDVRVLQHVVVGKNNCRDIL